MADLSLEFAPSLYAGHRKELGYNALGFVGCVHCWAVRLRVINHDFGISLGSSYFVTVRKSNSKAALPWPPHVCSSSLCVRRGRTPRQNCETSCPGQQQDPTCTLDESPERRWTTSS